MLKELYVVNIIILLRTLCGFMLLKAVRLVLVLGGTKIMLESIKIIAFINLILEYVKNYTNEKFF